MTYIDLNDLRDICHEASRKWWYHPTTGEFVPRNKGELMMLIVTEISEAFEGERKHLMDDKLPNRFSAEVELADAIIRILDYAGAYGYDIQGAFDEKMGFNETREDHAIESARRASGQPI